MTADRPAVPSRRPEPPERAERHFRAVLAGLFVIAYASNISTPFLSLYRDQLDLELTETQTIFVVYVAGIVITLLGSGPMSDRLGRRAVVIPALALSIVSSILIIAGRDAYLLLLVGRFLLGATVGAVFSVGTAWVQDLVGPGQELRVAFGNTVATYAGFGVGPVVSAVLELLLPYPLVVPFVVHIVVAGIVIVAIWPVPNVGFTSRSRSSTPELEKPDRSIPPTIRRLFIAVVVPPAVWVFAFPSTSFALFPVLLSDQVPGYAAQVAGAAGALTALAGLAARPVLARLGPAGAMVLGMAAGVIGYLLGALAFGLDLWPLVLPGAVLLGGASGTISAACLAVLAGADAGDARGAVTSAFYLVTYPGMAMPLLATTLATAISMTTVLAVMTVAATAGTALVVLTSRQVEVAHHLQPQS